jgi:hypothetical protein
MRLGSAWRKNSGDRCKNKSSDLSGLAGLNLDECVGYQHLRTRISLRLTRLDMRFSAVSLEWIWASALGITTRENITL